MLRAVNLGGDSDTTAAVTGGLAGIMYGFGAIPGEWPEAVARVDELVDLFRRFVACLAAS